jgi:hypothetical protein
MSTQCGVDKTTSDKTSRSAFGYDQDRIVSLASLSFVCCDGICRSEAIALIRCYLSDEASILDLPNRHLGAVGTERQPELTVCKQQLFALHLVRISEDDVEYLQMLGGTIEALILVIAVVFGVVQGFSSAV